MALRRVVTLGRARGRPPGPVSAVTEAIGRLLDGTRPTSCDTRMHAARKWCPPERRHAGGRLARDCAGRRPVGFRARVAHGPPRPPPTATNAWRASLESGYAASGSAARPRVHRTPGRRHARPLGYG